MTNESVIPRAGPFTLHHNGQMLPFAVPGWFWRHFEKKKKMISWRCRWIQFYRPHIFLLWDQERRMNMFGPGQEAISHEIVAKYHILRQMSDFGPIFEVKLRVLSTHRENSVQTATLQSTSMPCKSNECAQLWSGSNILRDNTEKPVFAALGRFWPNFEMKIGVLSTQSKSSCLMTGQQFAHTPS